MQISQRGLEISNRRHHGLFGQGYAESSILGKRLWQHICVDWEKEKPQSERWVANLHLWQNCTVSNSAFYVWLHGGLYSTDSKAREVYLHRCAWANFLGGHPRNWYLSGECEREVAGWKRDLSFIQFHWRLFKHMPCAYTLIPNRLFKKLILVQHPGIKRSHEEDIEHTATETSF